jgi:ABC-2 type transport system ATP-binding protein
MDQAILDIRKITKSYGDLVALDHFSLTLGRGEVIGLLGPNGAGKTTLISILSGTLRGFTGSVQFKGQDLFANRKLKNQLGIVPQEMAFYEELGALDNLLFWGGLYDRPRARIKARALELLDLVELSGRSREPVKRFSGGMKRRLNIAIGLIHEPELLLLDEPTVGIDVQAKVSILDIIRDVGKRGTSVVFTTHQLAEVEQTCSRIAIMDEGKLLAQGTLAELIRIVGERELVDVVGEFSAAGFVAALQGDSAQALPGVEVLLAEDNLAHLAVTVSDRIPGVLERLFQRGIRVSDLRIKTPNLEAVFLKLTGRSLRD